MDYSANYMLFDELERQWRATSLEELARENNPDIEIWVTTTYGWLANKLASATQKQEKTQVPLLAKVEVRPPEEIVAEYRPISKTMHYLRSFTSQLTFCFIVAVYFILMLCFCRLAAIIDMIWLIPIIIIIWLTFPSLCIKFFPKLKAKLKK